MNKKLLSSVREYKKQSVLAPILVVLEVLMEVLIPLEMAKIIDVGIANGDISYIIQRGVILVVMAMLSLFFGVQAGNMAAVAAAGYAKNLRHDIFYKVQDFSFKNIFGIDHPTTGVDNRKFLTAPIHFTILAVASGARSVVDNRCSRLCESVEKRRFAHIRTSYNSYQSSHISLISNYLFEVSPCSQTSATYSRDYASRLPLSHISLKTLFCRKMFRCRVEHPFPHV